VALTGHWLRLQGPSGPVSGFLYGSGAFERPTRRLAIFQEWAKPDGRIAAHSTS